MDPSEPAVGRVEQCTTCAADNTWHLVTHTGNIDTTSYGSIQPPIKPCLAPAEPCKHKVKGACALVFQGKVFCCHRALADTTGCDPVDIDKSQVQVVCPQCSTAQPLCEACRAPGCGKRLAPYICTRCILYSLDTKIYHCEKCQVCRVGPRENYFHCDNCNMCINAADRSKHVCFQEDTCAICRDSLHKTYDEIETLPCGHKLHAPCVDLLLSHADSGRSRCPYCRLHFKRPENLSIWATCSRYISLRWLSHWFDRHVVSRPVVAFGVLCILFGVSCAIIVHFSKRPTLLVPSTKPTLPLEAAASPEKLAPIGPRF